MTKKKKVEISIGEILVPCWFHWFFYSKILLFYKYNIFAFLQFIVN